MEKIINYFNSYLPLDQSEIQAFTQRLIKKRIKRRQLLLQEGDVCTHFTYVEQGCLKMFGVDDNGVEHNLLFAAENDWITDLGSLHKERPSRLYIEAVEPSVVYQISKGDLWYLYTNYPKFDRNFRVIIEDKYIELQDRLLQTYSTPALERYNEFLTRYPHLALRLPNTQIASYLGITPEFLSRAKKKSFKR
ncbi:MAG: Crp/Fnr family transcriptional regulator [Sphingobacteriaceae bacterium]|nr:Crp/Fnr family transcriptional regulator [Sphingobacteriaceae bacterium]